MNCKIVKLVLEKKFGYLTQYVIQKVEQANELELEEILTACLRTNNIEDFLSEAKLLEDRMPFKNRLFISASIRK